MKSTPGGLHASQRTIVGPDVPSNTCIHVESCLTFCGLEQGCAQSNYFHRTTLTEKLANPIPNLHWICLGVRTACMANIRNRWAVDSAAQIDGK